MIKPIGFDETEDEYIARLEAKLEEALGIIHDLLGLELNSGDRAMKFLDDNSPTAEDVRGILADVGSPPTPSAKREV